MEVKKPTILGTSDFELIIKNEAFYIDKSLFIKEFMEGMQAQVFLRPRRFGKSTNIDMLQSFLSRGSTLENFKHLEIYKDEKFCAEHCGQYIVISLDFKDCNQNTWDAMLAHIWRVIRKEVK